MSKKPKNNLIRTQPKYFDIRPIQPVYRKEIEEKGEIEPKSIEKKLDKKPFKPTVIKFEIKIPQFLISAFRYPLSAIRLLGSVCYSFFSKIYTEFKVKAEARAGHRKEARAETKIKIKEKISYSRRSINLLPRIPSFRLSHALISFIIICLVLSSFVGIFAFYQDSQDAKNRILGNADQGYEYLKKAQESIMAWDPELASSEFAQAYESFTKAQDKILGLGKTLTGIISSLPGGKELNSGKHLLRAVQEISYAGKLLTKNIQPLSQIADFNDVLPGVSQLEDDSSNMRERILGAGTQRFADSDSGLINILRILSQNINISLGHINEAEHAIGQVDIEDLPKDIQEDVQKLKEQMPLVSKTLSYIDSASQVLLEILGGNGQRKYLFIFQNNREIRATGGFIGSYAVLDFKGGKVKELKVDGIYNPSFWLKENIIPPEPFWATVERWEIQDANWFADFPLSAQKISWFYEKCGGPSVDGVITMTPDVISEILGLTGPISLPEYDTVIDKANFFLETQKQVELKYDEKENRPKKFIADLTPELFNKLTILPPDKSWQVFEILNQALTRKDILLHFYNSEIQNKIRTLGWDGRVKRTQGDYLSVINSNIGGKKSDAYIKEQVLHEIEVKQDGSIIDTVIITRRNTGEDIWPNAINKNYMRVFVPRGSELIYSAGFTERRYKDYDRNNFIKDPDLAEIFDYAMKDENSQTDIFEESGYTVFGGWVNTAPKRESEVTLRYKLPFKINLKSLDHYTLLVQKQSGTQGHIFQGNIILPQDTRIVWYYPEDMKIGSNKLSFENTLDLDHLYAILISR